MQIGSSDTDLHHKGHMWYIGLSGVQIEIDRDAIPRLPEFPVCACIIDLVACLLRLTSLSTQVCSYYTALPPYESIHTQVVKYKYLSKYVHTGRLDTAELSYVLHSKYIASS